MLASDLERFVWMNFHAHRLLGCVLMQWFGCCRFFCRVHSVLKTNDSERSLPIANGVE